MANTTNFNWETPDDTDLVKDGAAAIRTLGSAIDTSLVDLKGGTTGQILAKATNTDMDFSWITNDVGDITEVVASTPLTGGGASGSVTVGIQDGTTAQKGAVQLEDSTSSTSTTKAATPNSVKSAYDLANAAIPKSLVDAAGDIIYATANDTVARLALGTAGQVLKVNSGATAPEWGAAAGGATYVGVTLSKSTSQSIANNTFTALTWDQEANDSDGFHSTSSNTSRITIPTGKGGKYFVFYRALWHTNGTGDRRNVIRKNGVVTAVDSVYFGTPTSAGHAGAPGYQILNLAAGDYIEHFVLQVSGGNLSVYGDDADINFSTFGLFYLGA